MTEKEELEIKKLKQDIILDKIKVFLYGVSIIIGLYVAVIKEWGS